MRILFVCNTLYQIIGASCIREMFPAAEAEIILSDHSIANRKIYLNIEKFCIIFNKAYYVETKYLYEQDNNISKKEKDKLLSDINTVSSMLKLADEPTGNLDSVNGVEVMELLSELNRQGTTIIIVTHSQRDATYAHRIIRLLDGQIVSENINRPLEKSTSSKNEAV